MYDLSQDELRRIYETVRRRYPREDYPGLLAIGFGPALKNDRKDPLRPYAVTFFVRSKRTPRNKSERLPGSVRVRLKRGRTFVTLDFPTDVVGTAPFKLTGRFVLHGANGIGSVGAVIRWNTGAAEQWGLLTCAHFLRPLGPLTATGPQVTISVTGVGGFSGRVFKRAPQNSAVDAAIILVSRATLAANGIPTPAAPIPFHRNSFLSAAAGTAAGTSGAPGSIAALPFTTAHYYVNSGALIDGLPSLRDVFTASGANNTFPGGTSGSPWRVTGLPAAIQVAGRPSAFAEGVGQTLETSLDWARTQLGLTTPPDFMGFF